MSGSWRWWLVIPAVLVAFLVAACGGDDEGPSVAEPADEGVATEQPAEEPEEAVTEEAEEEDGGVEGGGDAFEGVPVPSGANEMGSGEWSGSIPGVIPGEGADPEDFTSLEYKQFEVDDSPEDVIDFYRDELSDWEETFVFSGGGEGEEGGLGVWMRDDVAVWITVGRTDGATSLMIVRGSP